jgi:hypothetical protein
LESAPGKLAAISNTTLRTNKSAATSCRKKDGELRKELNYWPSGTQPDGEETNHQGEEDVEGGKEVDEEKVEKEKEKEKERGNEETMQDGGSNQVQCRSRTQNRASNAL